MHFALLTSALLLPAACAPAPEGAYRNPGSPDALMQTSAEVVNISLLDADALEALAQWMSREKPTNARLSCSEADATCATARKLLVQMNVPYSRGNEARNALALRYERMNVKACENRYIDNTSNPYYLNHPAFGCANASNMVRHVTDKRQFTNPALLDYPDAEKAVQAYRGYAEKPAASSENSLNSSSLLQSGTGSGQ